MDQSNYDGNGSSWVASILVAELMAGDGFYTPEQGAQIVVRCILGKFYGDNPVTSDVTGEQGDHGRRARRLAGGVAAVVRHPRPDRQG